MPTDDLNLSRFIDAQQQRYASALGELKQGRKESHWIWYILPQLKGLGSSHFSRLYGISDLGEARAYLAHPVLGPRLIECIEAILNHRDSSAEAILGAIDALKFRSCLTLFSQAAPSVPIFATALDQFFAGQPDPRTIALLQAAADEIETIDTNPAKVVSGEAVHAWLRSWGTDDELPPPKAGQ